MGPGEAELIPYESALPLVERGVLVLAPHPDDEVFGCGGTLAQLVDRGDRVRVIVLADSAWGEFAQGADGRAARRAESTAAARILGYAPPEFWGLPDRGIEADAALIERIAAAIHACDIDVLLVPSPREIHPDHYQTALAALEAARRVGAPLRLLFFEVSAPLAPNRLVDITPVVERKRAAMRVFRSQLAQRRYDDYVDGLNRYRAHTLPLGAVAVEAFHEVAAADVAGVGLRRIVERVCAPRGRRPVDAPIVVSVLVRSVDRPTLREALDSVAAQTWQHIEIVVVASCASHRPLPAQWKGVPLRLIEPGPPFERAVAANVALRAARGDWLLFLDDDDLLLPDHLERLAAAALANGPACAPYAGVRVVDGKGATVDTYDFPDAAARLPQHNPFPIHAVLFPRMVVDAGLRFDERLSCFEDWDFWRQASLRLRFVHVPGVSAIYRAALGSSGISLSIDPEERERGRRMVLERWLPRMSPEEFDSLIARHRARIEEAQAETGAQRHRADDLQHQITAIQTNIQRIVADAERQMGELQLQRDSANALAQRLAEERDQLQAFLYEMRNSHSWRITAPLRATADHLRALRARLQGRAAVSAPITTEAAPEPVPDRASPVVVKRQHGVVLLVLDAVIDGAAIERALARLPADARICVIRDDAPQTAQIDPRLVRLDLPHDAGVDERIAAARMTVPGADVILVSGGIPLPDADAIQQLSSPFARAATIATVSVAATGADTFGLEVPDEIRAALGMQRFTRWKGDFSTLVKDWPGPRGAVIALRDEALRDLGAPRGAGAVLAQWAEWSRSYGWTHAVAPLRIASPSDAAPTVEFMREPEVAARWATYAARRDLADAARELVFEELLFGAQPPVLLLDHDLGGGANRYRAQRIERWHAEDRPVLLFHDDLYHDTTVAALHHPSAGVWARSGTGVDELLRLATAGKWSEVFFNNAAHARDPLTVPALLRRLKETTGAPLTFAVHDFYPVCPAYVLLKGDAEARHCGVPSDIAECERCLKDNRFDPHKGEFGMRAWRDAWGPAVDAADRVIAFSRAAAALFARGYPRSAERIVVEPHEVPHWPAGTQVPLDWSGGLRIGIVGSLSEAKGAVIVEQLIEEIARRGLSVPVTLIGQLPHRTPPAALTVTGAYRAEQLPRLLAAHRINCVLFPSICPETFSYVLSELMSLDLPICAFDLGAQGERLRAYAHGMVAAQVSAASALDAMLAYAARQTDASR